MSLSDVLAGAGQAAAVKEIYDEAIQNVQALGTQAQEGALELATEVAGMTEFQPFAVTTGLSNIQTTPEGGYDLNLTPQQQALQSLGLTGAQGFMAGIGQDPMQQEILAQARERFAGIGQDPRYQSLLSRADTAFGQAFADPTQARADVYEQLRAAQRPEEERQALALEERMLSQGRLGLSSDAYGGASPELLAQAKAREEAMATAGLRARQQVAQEQQQAYGRGLGLLGQASGLRSQELAEATGLLGAGYTPQQQQLAAAQTMMGLGYMPQQQALATLGYGIDLSKIPAAGQVAGAEFYGQMGQTGLESLLQANQLATQMQIAQGTGMLGALFRDDGNIIQDIIDLF